jgi:hypothetical protein
MIEPVYSPANDRYTCGMKYRRAGKSGICLPEISLGLWHNFGDVDTLANGKRILFCAFDRGITHFDLANNYGPSYGSAEETFGQVMKSSFLPYRDELFISTKAGHDMWEGPYGNWGSRKHLMASLDQSLKRMNLDYVDIFYSHRYDPETPLEETMQALVDMVDNFGGIEVYIPRDMSYGGSKLLKGYRNLDGASAEFFVRCRHGDGYANSDIDRLNMQRYFYAGLFKRARAMGITDILNQLPLIFKDYIHTDMDITTIAKLLASFLKIDSSNIILAQTPVFMGVPNVGKTDSFAGYSCVVPDAGSIANLLNQYFCTYTGPVEVSELHMVTDQWPHGNASTDANVQYMGRIDKESDDAILSGDTDLSGAVTTDGQAAGTGQ